VRQATRVRRTAHYAATGSTFTPRQKATQSLILLSAELGLIDGARMVRTKLPPSECELTIPSVPLIPRTRAAPVTPFARSRWCRTRFETDDIELPASADSSAGFAVAQG
jgi:hypothetical protein